MFTALTTLATTVPAGEPNAVAKAIHSILEGLFTFTQWIGLPNYALVLLIFTVVIRLLLYPLAVKQMRSTRNMQKIQPKLKEIQERYKGNPQKIQEAQLKLYQEMKYNPLSGCLPLLIQLPIIYILFTGIRTFNPLFPEFYTFFWISDLSSPDPSGIWLPLLVAASTALQQFISMPNRNDTTQKAMLLIMPVMMFFFCRMFPAGLALYWIFYGLLTGIQQFFVNRKGRREDAIEEARLAAEAEELRKKKEAKKLVKQQYRNKGKDLADSEDEADEDDESEDGEGEAAGPEEEPVRRKWAPPGTAEADEIARQEEARLRKAKKQERK